MIINILSTKLMFKLPSERSFKATNLTFIIGSILVHNYRPQKRYVSMHCLIGRTCVKDYILYACECVRFQIGWRGNETFLIRMWKSLPNKCVLKTVKLITIRNGSKRTISTSGGFGLLQMISELDTGQCVSKHDGPHGGGL